MKVTFFDVEYANAKNKSICQIDLSQHKNIRTLGGKTHENHY